MNSSSHCAPDRESHYRKYKSCLTLQELQKFAVDYNQTQAKEKQIPKSKMGTYKTLLPALETSIKYSGKCSVGRVDKCVVDMSGKFTERFRPKQPSTWKLNKNEWLSTTNIETVMNQYDKAYKNFQFLGVHAKDFAAPISKNANNKDVCVSRNMCQFIEQLKTNSIKCKRFGCVFNLDDHDEPGSHWVSLFCDLRENSPKYGVCYYDSVGDRSPKEIAKFMKMIKPNDKNFKVQRNTKQQQFQNSECGVFSMMFIILCLNNPNESYLNTISRMYVDKKDILINQQRQFLYRTD
jgi:hypothetical protein